MNRPLKWSRHEDLAIRRGEPVGREEFLAHMTFQDNLRPLFTEPFGPLIGLKEEWEEQGASPDELDFSAFRFRAEARGYVPVNTGRMGGLEPLLLEETGDYIITRDDLGRTMKMVKGTATLPLPLDYPVRTMDDWLKIKPMYEFNEDRFSPGWEEQALAHLQAGKVLCSAIPGGFDEPRQLLGEERLCLAYYEQPELVHAILDTIGNTAFQVLERVTRVIEIDLLDVHEDMAGKSGPMAGPRQVRDFILPYYRRIWDMLKERGTLLFDQDSDGNMESVIPAFLDAGVNVMHPIEPAAGMDIVRLRQQYGQRLAFIGGLDKHVLRRGNEAIEAELNYKLPPLVHSGGCVLGLDHRIPNGTPLEGYRYYQRRVWEILDEIG
jgi:uroporphyrinogen-III decarboxylase